MCVGNKLATLGIQDHNFTAESASPERFTRSKGAINHGRHLSELRNQGGSHISSTAREAQGD